MLVHRQVTPGILRYGPVYNDGQWHCVREASCQITYIPQWPRPVLEPVPLAGSIWYTEIRVDLSKKKRRQHSLVNCKLYNASSTKRYHFWQTGETSAGKSSIINLILGEDLLPSSILSTTSTICELKYDKKPGIRIHLKDCAGKSGESIYQELGNSSKTYKEEIEDFLDLKNERDKGSPYKKIELFWPHPLFKVTSYFLQVYWIRQVYWIVCRCFSCVACPESSKDAETQSAVSLCEGLW